jgi:phage gp16-like protein
MTIDRRKIALLHVAKAKLGLSDETYRLALAHIAGVTSSTELDLAGFEAIMGFFEWMGFKPLRPNGPSFGNRPGMASFAQIALIRALWHEYTHSAYAGEGELNKWLERCFKVSSLRFLKAEAAPKVITALKAMKGRHAA